MKKYKIKFLFCFLLLILTCVGCNTTNNPQYNEDVSLRTQLEDYLYAFPNSSRVYNCFIFLINEIYSIKEDELTKEQKKQEFDRIIDMVDNIILTKEKENIIIKDYKEEGYDTIDLAFYRCYGVTDDIVVLYRPLNNQITDSFTIYDKEFIFNYGYSLALWYNYDFYDLSIKENRDIFINNNLLTVEFIDIMYELHTYYYHYFN